MSSSVYFALHLPHTRPHLAVYIVRPTYALSLLARYSHWRLRCLRTCNVEKQLLEMISIQIQMLKPDNVPKPPYDVDPTPQATEAPAPPTPVKGKQPAKAGSKATSVSNTTISPPETKRRPKVPSPPQPWPALTSRLSPYSPALPSGVLIEAVKAGMSAQEAAPGIPGGGGKGKRKVVRVRG